MGGFLGIELADLAFAIERGDVDWVRRFLMRFPGLRNARDSRGVGFRRLAEEGGNPGIVGLFSGEVV